MTSSRSTLSGPILISVGTRPEIIKMAPLYAELRRRRVPVAWVHSGEHRDMADGLYDFFGIHPEYQITLSRRSDRLSHLNALLLEGLTSIYEDAKPSAVLVHGDTTSTLGSAQAAFYLDIPVGHVEAGLRSFKAREPFPEEKNREITARLARWHFAPTSAAAVNLVREGLAIEAIHTVGSTAVDAAMDGAARLDALLDRGLLSLPPSLSRLRPELPRYRLLTIAVQRREHWGEGIRGIAQAVARLLDAYPDLAVVWPVYGHPAVADTVHTELDRHAARQQGRLCLCRPLDYPGLLWCLKHSVLTLTDSDGIQEESEALSCPVLPLRGVAGQAAGRAVGGIDPDRVVGSVAELLDRPDGLQGLRATRKPLGDGQTSQRIADVLARDLGA